MEFFLPSILLVIFAAAVVFGLFPNMTPLFLAVLAIALLAFAIYNHFSLFGLEYQSMTWTTGSSAAAPYILVGVVVVFIIGYLLFLFGSGKRVTMNLPSATIPPPETATNVITNAIGNGLKAAGLAEVRPNAQGGVNTTKNALTSAELRSVASKIA
jgi:hypothetical protein